MRVIRQTRRAPPETAGALRRLATAASIEATPKQLAALGRPGRLLPAGTRVYVPFLPHADLRETAAACRLLVADGLRPVPHLAARALASRAELDEWLAALAESGAGDLLVIAGDRQVPGAYPDTLAVLETGLLTQHGFRSIGVAGHPEGHPLANRAELDHALAAKLDYATATDTDLWIVTQFVFIAQPLVSWLAHIEALGVRVPVYAGLPGPAKLSTLIAYAAQCGVSTSARILRRRPGAARLLAAWSPDGLVRDLGAHAARQPATLLAGLHVFPFGGVLRSANWLNDLADAGTVAAVPGEQRC